MGREDDDRAIRRLVEFLDEYRSLLLERTDDLQIVNDGAAHVNGSTMACERVLHGAYGPPNARTEASRRD